MGEPHYETTAPVAGSLRMVSETDVPHRFLTASSIRILPSQSRRQRRDQRIRQRSVRRIESVDPPSPSPTLKWRAEQPRTAPTPYPGAPGTVSVPFRLVANCPNHAPAGCRSEERFHGLAYGFVPRSDDCLSYAIPPAFCLAGCVLGRQLAHASSSSHPLRPSVNYGFLKWDANSLSPKMC